MEFRGILDFEKFIATAELFYDKGFWEQCVNRRVGINKMKKLPTGNKSRIILILLLCLANITSCTSKNKNSGSTQEKTPVQPKVVNLAIWSNYITAEQLQTFENKTGIKVQVSNYSSNEELLAKIQAGASGYDLALPSDYMVYVMSQLKLLQELNQNQIPNVKNVSKRWLKQSFDPNNTYSIPYDWGTTGIALNRTLYSGTIRGCKDLFEKEDLASKFSLLDDAREVIGAALKALGFSLNSRNPEELNKAKALLIKARSRVKAFTSEPLMPLVNGETAIAHIFVSDALQARRTTGGQIDYILPEEGGTLWLDNLVIPVGAQHIQEAYDLINFLLEPSTGVSSTTRLFLAPTSEVTFQLLPKELQKNQMLFPSPSSLSKCELFKDLGESLVLWDRIWTEVKAGTL